MFDDSEGGNDFWIKKKRKGMALSLNGWMAVTELAQRLQNC
jgi:hypothetical protein